MKYRFIFLIMLINFMIQSTVLQNFRVLGVIPNTALIIVVIMTVIFGTTEGIVTAITAGVFQDLFLSPALGVNLFIYTSLAILIGLIEDKLFKDNFLTPIIIISMSTLYYHLLYYSIMFFIMNGTSFVYVMKHICITETILNVLVCLIFYKRVFHKVYGYELR